MPYALFMQARPAQCSTPGSATTLSLLTSACIQSSRRPTISLQTGDMSATSPPAASRRCSPRSTAPVTAGARGTVKQTVALTLTPAAVAVSIACTPAQVTVIFTCILGAGALKRSACSVMPAASR